MTLQTGQPMIANDRPLEARAPGAAVRHRSGDSIDVVSKTTHGGICSAYCFRFIVNSLPLLLADLLALGCSLGCAYGMASLLPAGTSVEFGWLFMLTALTLPVAFAVMRLYPATGLNAVAELGQVGLAIVLLLAVFLTTTSMYGLGADTAIIVVVTCVILLATIPLFRVVARYLGVTVPLVGTTGNYFRRQ